MYQMKKHGNKTINNELKLQKGQTVIYQGEEAIVLEVDPVLTIAVKNKCNIVCGNTLHNEICLDDV